MIKTRSHQYDELYHRQYSQTFTHTLHIPKLFIFLNISTFMFLRVVRYSLNEMWSSNICVFEILFFQKMFRNRNDLFSCIELLNSLVLYHNIFFSIWFEINANFVYDIYLSTYLLFSKTFYLLYLLPPLTVVASVSLVYVFLSTT